MAATPITIEQRISAGNQFDGTSHSEDPSTDLDTGIRSFGAGASGGEFTFDFTSLWMYEVHRISGDFADASTIQVLIRNSSGDEVFIHDLSGSPGDLLNTDKILLAPDEKIVIITTGATQAMMARVVARPLIMKPS